MVVEGIEADEWALFEECDDPSDNLCYAVCGLRGNFNVTVFQFRNFKQN